jgi:predicted adenine nucleotide alpha hydrolase (AANH) superfamily ATPase
MPVRMLQAEGFAVTGVFYNPNIHPEKEYLLRRAALLLAADRLDLPLLRPDPEEAALALPQWQRAVPANADRNARCSACYALRLGYVARRAGKEGFGAFTSSLLYSRRQAHAIIAGEGEEAARRSGTAFLYRDFRPAWQEGIRLSKQWGLYRQRYCACIYSMPAPVPPPPIDSGSASV